MWTVQSRGTFFVFFLFVFWVGVEGTIHKTLSHILMRGTRKRNFYESHEGIHKQIACYSNNLTGLSKRLAPRFVPPSRQHIPPFRTFHFDQMAQTSLKRVENGPFDLYIAYKNHDNWRAVRTTVLLSANKVLLSAHSIFPDISEDYDGRVLSTAKRKMFEKLYFFMDRHETNRLESEKTSF